METVSDYLALPRLHLLKNNCKTKHSNHIADLGTCTLYEEGKCLVRRKGGSEAIILTYITFPAHNWIFVNK